MILHRGKLGLGRAGGTDHSFERRHRSLELVAASPGKRSTSPIACAGIVRPGDSGASGLSDRV
jgi:hypothetical protein